MTQPSLTPDQFARVRAIFEAAVDRPPAERRAYAAGACAGDAQLLRELEQMLAAEDHTNTLLPRGEPSDLSSSAHEEGRFAAGTVLAGRYKILGLLGRGGMGEVYKAFDQILNQVVALKFLSPAHVSEAALVRFRNEVRIARQVSHPNVCRVYDLGMVEGLHFLSMEFIDGEDLASLLRRIGRLPQDKATEFTRKICAGLAAAHERGVLHRDLKPANIMIDGRGQPRITDFGLAGLAAEIPLSDLRSGTPAYLSPEQKAGKEVTIRSDIYALGLVLHEMFTGKQRGTGTQTSPSDFVKDLDPAIERLILRCLEEDPGRRPQTALRVAMGLPGADPIAAALAAGETPSPEMVAASEEKEGFSPRTAILCFIGILTAFAAALVIQTNFLGRAATLRYPPDAMAERVQQMLRTIGYPKEAARVRYGYTCCEANNTRYLETLPPEAQQSALRSHRPAALTFFYQQEQPLVFDESSIDLVFPGDQPLPPELIRVNYDAAGRLLRLEVSPARSDAPGTEPVNWQPLFEFAELDILRFRPVPPDPKVALPVDEHFAWEGDYGPERPEKVRIEAGSRNGRPALFWVQPLVSASLFQVPSLTQPTVFEMSLFFAIFGAMVLRALFLAGVNLRLGRSDRRGGLVILCVALACLVGRELLTPHLLDKAQLVANSTIFLISAAICWPAYVAAEPQVRRNWPDALISWSRFCSGRLHNPLVVSHILAAMVLAELWGASLWPLVENLARYNGLLGTGGRGLIGAGTSGATLGVWFTSALFGLAVGLMFLMAVTQVRLLIRKLWLADTLAGIAVVFLLTGPQTVLPISVAMWLGDLWLLRRFGFLAFLSAWVVQTTLLYMPLTTSGWFASTSLTYHSVPLLIGAWATWVIVTGPRKEATAL